MAAGLAALASAMGIGRFAFTPMLPLMQAAGQLDLSTGAWLASANYLGYLVGALACGWLNPRPTRAVRGGLLAVVVMTAAMAVSTSVVAWIPLRFAAGVASACVLVGVSAWALPLLGALGRPRGAGAVYAGVGSGVAGAGVIGLWAGIGGWSPATAWWVLAAVAVVALAVTWAPLGTTATTTSPAPGPDVATGTVSFGAQGWRLIACYGSLGFGYIIPATFLPALARAQIADPAVFGWVWPVFGVAAAMSTVLASRYFSAWGPRRLWAVAQAVMALGVGLSALSQRPWSLLVCALCVGGTFMVGTMAGMQEARRVGAAKATTFMAAMTAAFATGQLLGPFTVGLVAGSGPQAIGRASALAAVVLLLTAALLWRPAPVTWAPPHRSAS